MRVNNSIKILKLNSRLKRELHKSMVKVLSLDQERYFLYIFQGRAGTQFLTLSPLFRSRSPSLFFASVSLSPPLFSTRASSPFPRKSEGKYFGHVIPIVLSQMPGLASYAFCAPLWVIFCYLILSRCSGLSSFHLRTFRHAWRSFSNFPGEDITVRRQPTRWSRPPSAASSDSPALGSYSRRWRATA